jgi:DNA-binding NtrC family response regulator
MSAAGKILVVDDHVALAENVIEILEEAGYRTAFAESAEVALERMASDDIAAIITDFKLPGLDGAQLIAELRRRGYHQPALVVSAYSDEATVSSSHRAGALAVLPKPVDIAELMGLVAGLGKSEGLVLVVDDHRELADNISEALHENGVDAVAKNSAAEALAFRGNPGAAVIDFRLPDATGVELARHLVARNPNVRVLFVSGHGDELRAAARGTPGDVLEKPVKIEHLIAWVTKALAHGQETRSRR